MPFVAQQATRNSTGGNQNLVGSVDTAGLSQNNRSNEIRRCNRSNGFDEEQRNLFRQLGRGEHPVAKRDDLQIEKVTLPGNCISRSCSQDGRVMDVEPRDINFVELVNEYGTPGEIWDKLPLRRQVEMLRPALRPRGPHIDPRSQYMRVWDTICLVSLIYTAVVTPYEVALIAPTYGLLFTINTCVDCVFLKDMVMQFMLKVRINGFSGSERWIRDPKSLAIHYLRGWFLLDFISILPVDHILALSLGKENEGGQKARALRVLRILRLVKLVRVLRASRVLQRWDNVIVLPFSKQALVKFIVCIATLSHWMACAWALFGRMLATNLVCEDGVLLENKEDPNGQSWITVRFWPPDNPCVSLHVYLAALHFSVMTITSIGYGDVAPTRSEEYLVGIACQVIGAFTWAFIIGSACGVITNMNPDSASNKQEMDELNHMLKRQNISQALRERLRRYMAESCHHKTVVRARELCQDFSPDLRGELVMSTPIGRAITNVWYFANCESMFLVEVAQSMVPRFFNKQEVCEEVLGMLGICQKGAVARNGHIYLTGRFWGEDMILSSDDLRDMFPVISLTFSEVLTLTRAQLDIIMLGVPENARKRLLRATMVIAVGKAARMVLNERTTGTRMSARLHVLLDEAKAVGDAAKHNAKHARDIMDSISAKHLQESIDRQRASVRLDPFHKQVVEELRGMQRCCAQDFQKLARRSDPVRKSSTGSTSTTPWHPEDETLPTERWGSEASAAPSQFSEQAGPLDIETLRLHLSDQPDDLRDVASPEALAELAAQVESLAEELARLGVPRIPTIPGPPPEPPPSSVYQGLELKTMSYLSRPTPPPELLAAFEFGAAEVTGPCMARGANNSSQLSEGLGKGTSASL